MRKSFLETLKNSPISQMKLFFILFPSISRIVISSIFYDFILIKTGPCAQISEFWATIFAIGFSSQNVAVSAFFPFVPSSHLR